MTTYSWANQARRFDSRYPSSSYLGGKVRGVLHTTETRGLPGYSSGASAPHLTAVPNLTNQTITWYQHFDSKRPSRALRNLAGGVQTNNLNTFQIELVGYTDKSLAARYGGIYWAEAPQWALDDVAAKMRLIEADTGIGRYGPDKAWPANGAAYGNVVRMSHSEWNAFGGWCGHMHVPENTHSDPGGINIAYLLAKDSGPIVIPVSNPPVAPPQAAPAPVRLPSPLPAWPLPDDHYFGRNDGTKSSVSGRFGRSFAGRTDRQWIQLWVAKLIERGWDIGTGRRWLTKYGNDGVFGDEMYALVVRFQEAMDIKVDGKLGPQTWRTASERPIT